MTCFRMKSGETMSQYCKKIGMSYGTALNRIEARGVSPDEAANPDYDNGITRVRIDGLPMREYAAKEGLTLMGAYSRYYRWQKPKVKKPPIRLSNGEVLWTWCRNNGMSYELIRARMISRGLTPDEAVNHVRQNGLLIKKTIKK